MAPLAVVAVALTLAGILPRASAEVYRFDNEEVPGPWSLEVKHFFYAWAREKIDMEPAEPSVLSAADVRVSGSAGEEYTAVQLSVLPWADFTKLVDPADLCEGGSIRLQKFPAKAWAHHIAAPTGKAATETRKIKKTGAYALVVSNCGPAKDLKISGSVSVKNPFGFLPGNDYYRLPLYGYAAVFWGGAGIIWLALLVAKKDAVVWAQAALSLIIILGFAETVAWWFALSTVNSSGEAPMATAIAEVLSVVRNIYALSFILVASMGLGVTEPDLERGQKIKVLIGSTLFGLAAIPRVWLASRRQAMAPQNHIVLLANLPVLIVGAFHFLWILRRLAHNMRRSKQLQQADSLKIFRRLAIVVCLCMLSAAGAMAAQLLDEPGRGLPDWWTHAFWNDGVFQGIALLTLLATMYFLAPSKSGFLAESYMTQVDDKDEAGLAEDAVGKDAGDVEENGGGKRASPDGQDGSMSVASREGNPEEGEDGAQPAASTIGAQAASSASA